MENDKNIIYGSEARKAIMNGVEKLAAAVSLTLGPAGHNVVLDRHFGTPVVTNDGVTIAKEVFLEDPFENMGAMLVRSASTKTNDVVGDGTTTAIVLCRAMIREGLKNVEAGANAVLLKSGMAKAGKVAEEAIKRLSRPVNSDDDIARIGEISSGSPEIGKLIAEALGKLPPDAILTLDDSATTETTVEIVDGMEFDRGYITPHMVNRPSTMEAVVDNPYILITDYKITSIQEILPIMEQVQRKGRQLFIISDGIETEPLAAIIVNQMKGRFRCLLAKAPSFGDRKRDLLLDFATVTGATVVTKETGMLLPDTTLKMLGQSTRVISTKDNTVIVGGKGNKIDIEERIAHVKDELALATFDYDIEKLQERLSKLNGGIGIIKVGAATEVEQTEKKMRIEDAIHATRAAKKEGVVPGGSLAFIHAAKAVEKFAEGLTSDEHTGAMIIAKALYTPIKQIASNAGLEGEVVLAKVNERSAADHDFGFDARNKRYCNLIEAGVIDPTKVVLVALENAVSVSSTVMTTESLVAHPITNKDIKNEQQ